MNGAISEESARGAGSKLGGTAFVGKRVSTNGVLQDSSFTITNQMNTSIEDSRIIKETKKAAKNSSTQSMRSSLMRPTHSFRGKMTFK